MVSIMHPGTVHIAILTARRIVSPGVVLSDSPRDIPAGLEDAAHCKCLCVSVSTVSVFLRVCVLIVCGLA